LFKNEGYRGCDDRIEQGGVGGGRVVGDGGEETKGDTFSNEMSEGFKSSRAFL
jgi:hypothetical protein